MMTTPKQCGWAGCDRAACIVLIQLRMVRGRPCKPLLCCANHTPRWARELGEGQTAYYAVRKVIAE